MQSESQRSGRQIRLRLFTALGATVALTFGCATTPPAQVSIEAAGEALQNYIQSSAVVDDRGHFRRVFCAVLEERGDTLPDYRSCDDALRLIGTEASSGNDDESSRRSLSDHLVLMVPGLGWNCFEKWLDLSRTVPKHLATLGYDMRLVDVDGLAGTESNAARIAEYVDALPAVDADRRLILVGYSKGTPDILTAIVEYPELAARVDAVVSLAGAVAGSPLSEDATQAQANMLTMVPGSACDKEDGDNDAVASLVPATRKAWLEENPLPPSIAYYSAVTFPEPERVSWSLRNSYLLLGETDVRNDTQLVVFDQMIPGSKVFGLMNADHWAVAVPIRRAHPIIGSTLIDKNDYPREAFAEALLRYLEEDLASP